MLSPLFADSPEYLARSQSEYVPPATVDLNVLRSALPNEVWERSTLKGLLASARVALICYAFSAMGSWLERHTDLGTMLSARNYIGVFALVAAWLFYWWWQGLAWAGLWSLGHEADHGNISPIRAVNHAVGYFAHTFIVLPYFSWRITHLRHHKYTAHAEKEEVFAPYARSELKLPPEAVSTAEVYKEALEDAPIVVLFRFLVMQLVGHHTYLLFNTMGAKRFPPGSNHFTLSSQLFKKTQRSSVLVSNIGIVCMLLWLAWWAKCTSYMTVVRLYVIPWTITNHWVVTMAFLQHSCTTVPHFRDAAWTWQRGALSTIDRPFLGFIGNYILLGVNQNHTVHHLFTMIPFYNLPKATEIIRPMLGGDYNYDSTGTFRALWRSFTQCVFVEDDGDILFYKNARGATVRRVKE